jgi:HEAT repeat protein
MTSHAADVPNPTALLSWAHRSPGWDDDRTAAWQEEIVQLVRELRMRGIDVDLDLHHSSERGIDWTRFGPRAVMDNDWVIVALSPGWRERWEARNDPTTGAGTAAEADALLSIFYGDGQDVFRAKLVLAILPSMRSEDVVPAGLHGIHRFEIDEISFAGLEPLLRLLTDQPRHPAEPLGTIPDLPPAAPPNSAVSRQPEPEANSKATDHPQAQDGTERVITALSDPDSDVRYDALGLLRDRLHPNLLPKIETFLDDPDPYTRRLALEYHAQLTGPTGTERVITALSDPDSDVRYDALGLLRDRLHPNLLPKIETFLDDPDPYTRRLALEYHAQLTGR